MDFSTIKKNLEAKGYTVTCFENGSAATEYLSAQITGKTVGFGGSMTLRELGLYDILKKNNETLWHWQTENKDPADLRERAGNAEIYFSSVNGMSEDGQIINIDGSCNRVASILYGHKKVFLVVGRNKIAKDYDAALFRARNIAAPLNAKRLGVDTPCAVKGDKCYDCNSPSRICRALSVLWKKPSGADIEVVLIDQDLGY